LYCLHVPFYPPLAPAHPGLFISIHFCSERVSNARMHVMKLC
jgi:hypothetical protein